MRKPSGKARSVRMKISQMEGAPAVAAVITGGIDTAGVRTAVLLKADILEVRVDTFTQIEPERLLASFEKLKKITDLPILLTIRSSKEGGQAELHDRQRAALYEALIPFADLVDIELSSSGIRKNVVDSAKRAEKRVIVSHHDFESTPGDKKLRKIIESARASGGDIVKIASLVKSAGDLRRLAGLLCSEEGLIIIGMGPLGMPSRVFFPFLGSLITYCSVTESTAPGQMSLKEMRTELKRYGM